MNSFKRYIRNRIKRARKEKSIIVKNSLKNWICDNCHWSRISQWQKEVYCTNNLQKKRMPKERTCRLFIAKQPDDPTWWFNSK
jgi:hypothetical protein